MFGFIRLAVRVAIAGALLATGIAPVSACESLAGGTEVTAESISVSFRPTPVAIAVSRHFTLDIALCSRGTAATLTRVDATMPEHRHGMNYRPTLSSTGENRYRAEGLLFHMPGRWQFLFEVRVGAKTERLTHSISLH